jgi:hypothetical protein
MTPTDPFTEAEAAVLRDALGADAEETAEAGADMLDGIRARAGAPRSRRMPWLLAAAAVLLVVGLGALLLPGDGGDEQVDVADGSDPGPTQTTEAPSTTAPDTTGTTGGPRDPAELPPRPDVLVGVTEDGRLVVIDVDTGEELRELWALADPTAPLPDDAEIAPNHIAGVALHPNGRDVFVETCCEPAGGSIFTLAIDGSTGEPTRPTHSGYGMDVSADGRWLAAMSTNLLLLQDLEGDDTRSFDLGEEGFEYARVAVNDDGTEVTAERVLDRDDEFRTLHNEAVVLRLEGEEAVVVDRVRAEPGRRAIGAYGRFGSVSTGTPSIASIRVDATGSWALEVGEGIGIVWHPFAGPPGGWTNPPEPATGQVPWQGPRLVDGAW